jgi:predicted ribosomally synthesized peptide with SipW-like signal peptide
MKKRLILTTIIIGVLSFGIGMGTFAYFTSTATSKGNVFAAGTLEIGASNEGEDQGVIEFKDKAPGDNAVARLVVKNIGSIPFRYKASAASTSDDLTLYNQLNLIVKSGWTEIYNGKLSDFVGKDVNTSLAAGADETLAFVLTFPADSGNEYQGAKANIQFTFDATQVNAQ